MTHVVSQNRGSAPEIGWFPFNGFLSNKQLKKGPELHFAFPRGPAPAKTLGYGSKSNQKELNWTTGFSPCVPLNRVQIYGVPY